MPPNAGSACAAGTGIGGNPGLVVLGTGGQFVVSSKRLK
jgi:hypothetical protein